MSMTRIVLARANRGSRGVGGASGGGTDPFTWYPLLDKATIPFHAGAGEWGSQSTIDEAAAPTGTMTDVTASTAAELATHIYTANRRITLTGNIAAASFTAGNITDVDIIVPPGILWDSPTIGSGLGGITVTRLRIRGSTVGSHSGGQVHRLNMIALGSDFIVDGLDISGPYTAAALAIGSDQSFSRAAVVNNRINAGGFAIGSTASDIVIAGNSILTGSDTAAETDLLNEEAYGIRNYFETNGNIVVFNNEIRSNPARVVSSHARWRVHPDAGIEYVWGRNNRFVERVENHIHNIVASEGGGSGSATANWFLYNEIISTGTGTAGSAGTPKLYGNESSVRAYIQNNAFQSDDFTSDTDISLGGTTATTKSGNTYASLPGSDPAWGATLNGLTPGAGDPSGIDYTP